jgi:hypothetical protein
MRAIRLLLVHLALGALGCWAVWAQAVYRVPSTSLTLVLSAVTVAMTALTPLAWIYAAFGAIDATPAERRPLVLMSHAFSVIVLGFTFYSLFLFANGKFDLSEPVPHATEIVSIGMEEPVLGVDLPFTWATVRSWREPGGTERILLRWAERERLWGGQPIVVSVRRGYYGRPWVSAIEHDVEKQSRAILAVVPGAAQIRKDLAMFYARTGRFADAASTTRDYTRDFPDDRAFPVSMAWLFTSRDRFADVITALADVAPRREDAEVYMLLGYALAMHGQRRADGLAYLERARTLQPRNWWPHYALGWAYAAGGDYARAVPSFERAVAMRHSLADAERELMRLRPLVAKAPAR